MIAYIVLSMLTIAFIACIVFWVGALLASGPSADEDMIMKITAVAIILTVVIGIAVSIWTLHNTPSGQLILKGFGSDVGDEYNVVLGDD